MKKIIITLLIVSCVFAGNAQTQSSDSVQHKEKSHRRHHSHNKGDRHHKENRLFHGHHHQGKDHARADTRPHHGRKGSDRKTKNDNE